MFEPSPSAPQTVVLGQATSKAAYDYWNALRNGRAMPHRRDVDPALMRGILPDVMLLEHVSKATVVRLAGTRVCFHFGRELRDHDLLSLWEPSHRGVIGTALARSLATAAPLLLRCRGHALGRRPLPGEVMLLPLRDDAGAATRILGGFAFVRDPFGPKVFTRLELSRAETILPGRDRVELAAASPAPGRAELTLVHADQPARAAPTMAQPWSRLFREFLRCEEG